MNLIKLFYHKKPSVQNLRANNLPEGVTLLTQCWYSTKVELILRNLIHQRWVDPRRIDVVLWSKIGLEVYNWNKKLKNSDEIAKINYVLLLKE